jgi:hypothetical protein
MLAGRALGRASSWFRCVVSSVVRRVGFYAMNISRNPNEASSESDCVDIGLLEYKEPKWKMLPKIPHAQQEQGRWCWAAVAASIAEYYEVRVKQCSIADAQLGRQDCCQVKPNTDGEHNKAGFLMAALFSLGHFREWDVLKQATPAEIRAEIGSKRPLCVRLFWSYQTGHFVTVVGYADRTVGPRHEAEQSCEIDADDGLRMAGIAISDPFWGLSDIDSDDFSASYAYGAEWTDSYYTRPK